MKPIHIQLLELLENNWSTNQYNISEFMLVHFPKPQITEENKDELHTAERKYRDFLRYMVNNLYINCDTDLLSTQIGWGPVREQQQFVVRWFDTVDLFANITVNGLEYLDRHRLTQSNMDVNEASIRSLESSRINARTQRRFTRTTIGIAAIGAFSSLFTFICNNPKIRGVEVRIDSIQKAQRKQDTLLRDLQSLQASQKDSFRNDQPSSVNKK